eukprot:scaffold517002_cov46-Prasinocladus_malaysianus.AAC.1
MRRTSGLNNLLAAQLGSLCASYPAPCRSYAPLFCRLLLEGSPDNDMEGVATIADPLPQASQERDIMQ